MSFDEVLSQVLELLRREGRMSYRAIKRRFSLDDEYLEDLKTEIIRAKRLAIDEDGAVLVWAGSSSQTTSSAPQPAEKVEPGVTRAIVSDEAERRQLTVMFCDLVDSTPLSEQFDPEELRELIRAYQHACNTAIARFDGHIAKYLGDGLLAYFGYPLAHEDDAQRAVRAALGLVAAIRTLNAEHGKGVALKVRLGIHTGLVVVGEMGAGEFREQAAIVGDTPNTADRLQEIAAPDTVVISGATYQLVRGLFNCESLGLRALKGLSAPVQVYRVLHESNAQSRFDVAMQSGLTPLVGRESESTILNERWQRARNGEGQVVLLSGEPGIGKSRLVQALKERIATQPGKWLECHCSPYHQNSPQHPIIDLLQRQLAFQSGDDSSARLERLERELQQCDLGLPDHVPLLAPLLSLPVPEKYPRLTLTLEAQKEKTHVAVESWLFSMAEREGMVLVIEDLHWADPSTLELLRHVLNQVATARLLVVLTYRLEFAPVWSGRSHFATITLDRLPRSQSEGMVQNLTGGKGLPTQILDQIIAKTDGVPLFVEELTRMVVESGLLRERDGCYELAGPLPPLAIPSTLQDSLTARLDRLGSPREVAQLAATIGRDFSYELLRAITLPDESALQKALAILVDAEVLYRRGVIPQARFVFKHALIRDAAYESLLKSRRQQIHSRIARELEEQFPETAETQPELIAHHYTQAGLAAQAIPYWQKAGEQALERCAFIEAINHLARALDMLPEWTGGSELDQRQTENGEVRCRLLLAIAEAERRGGQPLKAQQSLLQATGVAQALSSVELVSRAAVQMVWSGEQGFSIDPAAIRLSEEALERIGPEDSPLRAVLLGGLTIVLGRTGASQRALDCGQQGIAIARRLGRPELAFLGLQGMCYALQAPEHAALRLTYADEIAELGKSGTHRNRFSHNFLDLLGVEYWRSYSLLELGNVVAAKQDISDFARTAQERQEPFVTCLVKGLQACEALLEGRFDDYEHLAQEALAIGQNLENESAAGIFGMQMFTLRREQGRLREVEPLLRHFVQTEGAHAWRPGLALIYTELGLSVEATSEFESLAQNDFADLPRDSNSLVSLTYMADICTSLGDRTRASTLYELLLPYRQINVLFANASACYGSASRYLGALAAVMARWNDAERHFEDALAMNSAMGARPWLAHTQYQYARMLLARDQAEDSGMAATLLKDALATARELGMRALEHRITSGSP
jgi:class 3 adenylate cyclase/tetratricopeptide (TPR) repeat protein